SGKRDARKLYDVVPFASEVSDALVILSGRSQVPTSERYVRRRGKILGRGLSSKRALKKKNGRPRQCDRHWKRCGRPSVINGHLSLKRCRFVKSESHCFRW